MIEIEFDDDIVEKKEKCGLSTEKMEKILEKKNDSKRIQEIIEEIYKLNKEMLKIKNRNKFVQVKKGFHICLYGYAKECRNNEYPDGVQDPVAKLYATKTCCSKCKYAMSKDNIVAS